ncbi:hypothetical protein NW768_000985 [Fusarium equiseti]|uniref:Uncharacterized protein n=1 Tax=Fusarium equiseti TaxID=61235 RepID=A0ABQ8RUC8_FUSEQ|nr:hypothetical protein NW768_000985 [Fusarium equiseti]
MDQDPLASEVATITSGSMTEATSTALSLSSTTLALEVTRTTVASEENATTTTAAEDDTTTTATSEGVTTTTSAAQDTTTLIETFAETTSAAATTSEAPAAQPTYVLSASGGSLNGAQPQGTGNQGTFIGFDPRYISGATPRKFTIDSTGRLQDAETQAYVCAYYFNSQSPVSPPFVVFCAAGPVGGSQGQEYLTCEVNNGNFACKAPRVFCSTDINDETTCPRPGGDPYDTFFINSEQTLLIGTGSPPNTTPISISARKQR